MAININNENLIRIVDVPDWCQVRLSKQVHLSTIHRWRAKGIRGVTLETLLIGGTRMTSEEALERFFRKSTDASARKSDC